MNLSLSVSKHDYLHLEYSLLLFSILEFISESNQGLELALILPFLIGVTESIALMNLFIKSDYAVFIFLMFFKSFLLCNISLTRQAFRYVYENLIVEFFVYKV